MKRQSKKISKLRAAAILTGYLAIAAAIILFIFLILYWTGVIGGGDMFGRPKVVGKNIELEKVQQFYYTWSTSTDPPDFLRYRFYVEDGKYWFYHEQREGDHWPLTEQDITVSGKKELTLAEREAFFNLIKGGTVVRREVDVSSGKPGPWLYLYWDGDDGEWQQFSFADPGDVLSFEDFCKGLVE